MEIVNFGHFTAHTKDDGILYFKNEDAQDWYELRVGLTTWDAKGAYVDAVYGAWAMVDPDSMKITNVEYDPSRLMPGNRIVLGIDAEHTTIQEGQIYTGTDIVDAPPPTIEEQRAGMRALTPRQLRLTLVRNGYSLSSIATAIDALPDGPAKEEAQIDWEYATKFNRLDPTLLTIASALNLADTQVDALWEQALAIA